jgi:hypothetical protein
MFILLQDGDSYVYSGSVSSSDATEQVSIGTKLQASIYNVLFCSIQNIPVIQYIAQRYIPTPV